LRRRALNGPGAEDREEKGEVEQMGNYLQL